MFTASEGMNGTYKFLMSPGLGIPQLEGFKWLASVAQTHEELLDALDHYEKLESFLIAISSPTMVACAMNDKREDGWWETEDDRINAEYDEVHMNPDKCPGHPDDWYWDDHYGWCLEDDLPF